MKIFIDTGHPAHLHFYIPITSQLIQKGHSVSTAIREKDCTIQLAEHFQLPYISKGKGSYSMSRY